MNEQEREKLRVVLQRLEESSEKIIKTNGYTEEAEQVKILEELIKEQLQNENTRHATRSPR